MEYKARGVSVYRIHVHVFSLSRSFRAKKLATKNSNKKVDTHKDQTNAASTECKSKSVTHKKENRSLEH